MTRPPDGRADVVGRALTAAHEAGPLHALITVCDERARAAASTAVGPLAGRCLVAKDMYDVAGVRTTYGSRCYEHHVPEVTASAVARAEQAGAVLVAKANQDEFAWGVTGRNERWGDVVNPRDPDAIPGGSSAGNAAALAAGVGDLGLGTDTAGSARYPAACCGIVGFRPRAGAVDRRGCLPLAPSFDAVSPMARSVAACAELYAVLAATGPVAVLPAATRSRLRVGVVEDVPALGCLEAWGARLVDAPVHYDDEVFDTVFRAEAAAVHASLDRASASCYGEVARARFADAVTVDPHRHAEAVAALAAARAAAATDGRADVWVGSTIGPLVPRVGTPEAEVRAGFGGRTRVYSALDWPALAIGNLQVAGPNEALVLAVGLALEQEGAV